MSAATRSTGDDRCRVALVTGGTRGIGRAIALALAREGRHVIATYARNRAAADALIDEAAGAGLSLTALRGDVRDASAREAHLEAATEAGQLDALVLNAANAVHRPVDQLSSRHLEWTLGVNVVAAHALLVAALPRLGPGASVVGVSSAGSFRALPAYAALGAAKAGLESLLRHAAAELAPRGICVNCVCPGIAATVGLDALPEAEARRSDAVARTPTGRLTTPDDVAAAVAFLCSPAARQVVGQTLVIDGGRSLV